MLRNGRPFSGHERHCAFLNTGASGQGDGRFACISAISGLDLDDDGRAIAATDWDQDGDVDLWLSNRNGPRLRFLRNESPAHNHFLTLRLLGNGKTTNRDAIGARVEVYTGEADAPHLIETLRAGEGFLGQSSKWLLFGLGTIDRIEKVVVHWPGAANSEELEETFIGFEADQRYLLVQGSGTPVVSPSPARELKIKPSPVEVPPPADSARILLDWQLPMLHLQYQTLDGKPRNLRFDERRPVLVNLWATSCAPCLKELAEFRDRKEELRRAGIDVVALSVDGLQDPLADPKVVEATLDQLRFPFTVGLATPGSLSSLQLIHDLQMVLTQPLPVPTSFLVDARGQLIAIYLGPVSVDDLLHDLQNSDGTSRERFIYSSPLPGRVIDHERMDQLRLQLEVQLRFKWASIIEQVGRLQEAARHYQDIVILKPDYAAAQNNLGSVLARLGRFQPAQQHLILAIEAKPNFAYAHFNLANVYKDIGEISDSIREYEETLRIEPDNAIYHFGLGLALLQSGEYQLAANCHERATQLDDDFAAAHNGLGFAMENLGDNLGAMRSYERALDIDSKQADAATNLQRVLSLYLHDVCGIESTSVFLLRDYRLARARGMEQGEAIETMKEELESRSSLFTD